MLCPGVEREREIRSTVMTPFDDFVYLINSILLGEEPTIEDFILLIGTFVAFIAFILWCCFPIVPKESNPPAQYDTQYTKYKKTDHYDDKM
ncbi:hypothetical protein Pmani_014969 [Petrolisthes manimaculis]|uniref:Uncharacterized protein n=1 Tax=Petrolisthes manimaculis TaxID=1843537 RepID=A0AAE1PRR1_9EUCA|nr:hypothetical protein Pmani_014969 [Petrolisthes manimaculis]